VNRRFSRLEARAWGRRQLYSLFSSLGALLSHRLGTLMTVLVLGIAMLLPLGLFVTLTNLRSFDLQPEDWGSISVFLQPGLDPDQALELAAGIEREHGAGVNPISPEQGLRAFQEATGFRQALELFDENPLPWVLQVTVRPAPAAGSLAAAVREVTTWLETQDGVDLVRVDYKWLERLSGMLAFGDAFVVVLTVLFSLAVIVVVANTIRLDVAKREHEIEVLHLVGATDGFVRQPFLYLGFWYGVLGAILALLMLTLCMAYLARPLEQLIEAYGNTFQFSRLGFLRAGAVVFFGGFLGLAGAWIAVQRYLRQYRLSAARGSG